MFTGVNTKLPATIEELVADVDVQDILILNLTRAVQLCVDIGSHVVSHTSVQAPATMAEVFLALARIGAIGSETAEVIRRAVGFRNVAVHNYDVINWQIVRAIASGMSDDFARFVAEIETFCSEAKLWRIEINSETYRLRNLPATILSQLAAVGGIMRALAIAKLIIGA